MKKFIKIKDELFQMNSLVNIAKTDMKYFCDLHRHLVCVPYSIENLHKMADDLEIGRHWFHKDHYDIPKKRIEEITNKCKIINSKNIVKIIKQNKT